VGLELSEAMIAYARDRFGVEVQPKTLEQYADSHPPTFDILVLNAILEHVHDPDGFLRAAHGLTHPGSLLYIDVPQEPNLMTRVGNLWNRLRGNQAVYNLQPTWPPYHVFGFNPVALTALLRKHGFRIESIRIWASPHVPSSAALGDRVRSLVAEQINRIANWTGSASNMFVWARRS
jgi:SAM-dependent methyltransferase